MESLAHERQYLRDLCVQNALVERARGGVQSVSKAWCGGQRSRNLGPESRAESIRERAVPRLMSGPGQHCSNEKVAEFTSPALSLRRDGSVMPRSGARCTQIAISSADEKCSPGDEGASDGWMVSPEPASGVSRAVPFLGCQNPNQHSRVGVDDGLLRTASQQTSTSLSARSAESTWSMSSDKTSPSQTTKIACAHAEPAKCGDAVVTGSKDAALEQRVPEHSHHVAARAVADKVVACGAIGVSSEPRETLRMSIRCLRQPSPSKSSSKQRRQFSSRSPPPEEMGQVCLI